MSNKIKAVINTKTVVAVVGIVLATLLITTVVKDLIRWRNNDPALESVADCEIMGMSRHVLGTPHKTIKVLETDDYGRVLFSTFNDLGNHRKGFSVTAYVVCQRTDGNTGYCLPDVCYELVQFKDELPEDRMLDLKARNGWNTEPTGEGWVECRSFTNKAVDTDALVELFESAAGLKVYNNLGAIEHFYIESDANGNILYGLIFYYEGQQSDAAHLYLISTDSDNNVLGYLEVNGIEKLPETVINLKIMVGWEQLTILC